MCTSHRLRLPYTLLHATHIGFANGLRINIPRCGSILKYPDRSSRAPRTLSPRSWGHGCCACTALAIARVGALCEVQVTGKGINAVLVTFQVLPRLQSYKKMSPFFIPYAITNMGSALLAIDHGFLGPNYSISTACATANYAFHAACMHIRNGEADVMLAGGSEAPIIPVGLGGFVACRSVLHHVLYLSLIHISEPTRPY